MKKGAKRGFGLYLVLIMIGVCFVVYLQSRNTTVDTNYTIDDFKAEISEGVIAELAIYQNSKVPTGTVQFRTTSSVNSITEFYVSDVNVVQDIVMEYGDGNIKMSLQDVASDTTFFSILPIILLVFLSLFLVMLMIGGGAGGGCCDAAGDGFRHYPVRSGM